MKRLIYPILILLIATMACTIGSFGQPAPTSTVEPSSTPLFEVPTAIPIIKALPTDTAIPAKPTTPPQPTTPPISGPTATAQIQGGLNTGSGFFNEDFKGNVDDWKQWVTAGDPTKNYAQLLLGRLRFELPSTESYVYVQNTKYTYKDVLAVATFETVETDGKNGIAIVCRYSDQGWYELRVSNMGDRAGWIQIYRYDPRLKALGENPYVNLLLPTYQQDSLPISTIKNGFAVNTIGLQCSGNTLSVYANGQAMIHPRLRQPIVVTDNTLQDGTVGVGVMSFSTGKVYIEFISVSTNQPQ
ncbi:MAG: hypothetical protein ABSE06_01850 [Anaerolineaceae bacterium]|jgi:hypothetical protein